jgi:hypothetical protein
MATKLRVVQRPELIAVGKRSVSPSGWHHYPAEEHLNWHLTEPQSGKWCRVECMAKTMFLRNTPANCTKVRARLPNLVKRLIARNRLLVIEYDAARDGHNKMIACKIFEASGELERDHARRQLDRMHKRIAFSQEMRGRMLALIGD